jgi:four helix bundle protein
MFLQLSHTKLDAYQYSQELALECYRITRTFPVDEKFAMIQQIRRAALSVHLNISEGAPGNQRQKEYDFLKSPEVPSLKLTVL